MPRRPGGTIRAGPEEVLALTLPQDLSVDPAQRQALRACSEATGVLEGVEVRWKRKGGQPLTVSLYARALRDARGRVVSYEGLVLDVTARAQAEAALRESVRVQETGCPHHSIRHLYRRAGERPAGCAVSGCSPAEGDRPPQPRRSPGGSRRPRRFRTSPLLGRLRRLDGANARPPGSRA